MLPYTVKKDKERVDTSKYIYDLSTVVVHQGTIDTGHYYAYTRVTGDKVHASLKPMYREVLLTYFHCSSGF